MDRERRRQAVITAGLGIFLAWMSSGGADIMRRRRDARLHLAALALVYISNMRSQVFNPYYGLEDYYGPGFRYDTYTLTTLDTGGSVSRYAKKLRELMGETLYATVGQLREAADMLQRIINSNAIP